MILPWIISNWRLIAYAIAIVGIFTAGYGCKATLVKASKVGELNEVIDDTKQADKERLDKGLELEKQLQANEAEKEIRYVEKQKIIYRDRYISCKLDDDGVQLLTKQINNVNAARKHAYTLQAD